MHHGWKANGFWKTFGSSGDTAQSKAWHSHPFSAISVSKSEVIWERAGETP